MYFKIKFKIKFINVQYKNRTKINNINNDNFSLEEKKNIEAVKLQRFSKNCHSSMYYRRFKQPLIAFGYFPMTTNLLNCLHSFIFTFPSSPLGITLSLRVCLVQPRGRGGEMRCGKQFLRRGGGVKYNLLC
jgi:hypothetical protein